MTKEEAIKIIDCYDIGFYDLSGKKIPADKLAEAFDMAIEALSADAVQGEWIEEHDCEGKTRTITCSKCGWAGHSWVDFNFCPNCGARMKGGAE